MFSALVRQAVGNAGLDASGEAQGPRSDRPSASLHRKTSIWFSHMHAHTCPNPELTETLQAHLVLQPVPPPPHVHVPGVGVIEAALAQLAVEPDHFALAVAHLGHKAQLGIGPWGRAPPSTLRGH